MKKFILSICIFYCLIIVGVISNSEETVIYVNSEKIIFKENLKNIEFDLSSLSSEDDVIITCEKKCENTKVNGINFEDNVINLGKLEISAENKIVVSTKNSNIIINTLPSDFPKYEFNGQSKTKGDYYLTTYDLTLDEHYILKINNNGKIIFYKSVSMSFDFDKIITDDGKIRYTYLEKENISTQNVGTFVYASLVVLDENYQEINRIKYNENDYLENHAYLYKNDDEYFLATYEFKNVTNVPIELNSKENSNIVANKIKYVKDDKTIWEFDSTDYIELYEYSTLNNNYNNEKKANDYVHFNSMIIDPNDGNLLVSLKNIDGIIKLNINNGNIIWYMSGKGDEFSMLENQKFYKQHSLGFTNNGYLTIFDNGNYYGMSRVIKLKYDDSNMKITDFKEYSLTGFSKYMGSFQMLDISKNIGLICYGYNPDVPYGFVEKDLNTGIDLVQFRFINSKELYKVNKK